MTKFVQRGTTFQVTEDADLTIFGALPAGTYNIGFDKDQGRFFLKMVEDFTLGKIYGDIPKKANRILDTYQSREFSTGALLSGDKGCGKTMLAKLISIEAKKRGIPTIIINSPWIGEVFNKFIQSIEQECVIIFDEYEKVYCREDQQHLLTLLDGVYPTHKLFILTTNDRWAISDHMLNRPGRLFYALEYKGLPTDFVKEYCEDNLKNKDNLAGVLQFSAIFNTFNFDMLKAVVEEMNRYDETIAQAITMMNIKAENDDSFYNPKVEINGKEMTILEDYKHGTKINPLKKFTMYYYPAPKAALKNVRVTPDTCVSIKNGTYVYKVGEITVTLIKQAANDLNIADLVSEM